MMNRREWRGLRGLGFFLSVFTSVALAPRSFALQMPIIALNDTSPKASDSGAKVTEYEVASVKENKGDGHMMRTMTNPDGFSGENLSLQNLIADAYGIRQDLISGGPGWVESKGFDVDAKVAGSDIEQLKKITPRQRASMLQPVLAERFKLKVHIETKQLPVYELVVMKGGTKLKEAPPRPLPSEDAKNPKNGPPTTRNGSMMMGPGEFSGFGLPIAAVSNELSYVVHRTVLDKTELTGKYDVALKWSPEEDEPKQDNGSTESAPSIFTAVQEQLGLKLLSTKGPVDTLVIDHVELPSEN